MAPSRNPPSASSSSTTSKGTDVMKLKTGLWMLETIPGKGKGLIASQNIASGTLILTGIIRSNAYPLGRGIGGLFPNIARINHSCRPNCHHAWNNNLGKEAVYAIRPIAIGEELTLSYIAGGPSFERQLALKEQFRFNCACEVCSLPLENLKASDARLLRAQHFYQTIGDPETCHYSPEKVLRNGHKLRELYALEGIKDDRLPNLYNDMFQVCNMHTDQARAGVFADMYCQEKRQSEGLESDDAEEMLPFVANPMNHGSFGCTRKWETSVKQVLSTTHSDSFGRWLWREEL